MPGDFFSQYLAFAGETEVPAFFSRWAAISGIGAFLGRRFFFQHGHFNIYPNQYCMLIGSPGTRKSTAIKLMRKLLQDAGYDTIAADKTTKEKFMLDLAGEGSDEAAGDILDQNLFGDIKNEADAEMFVMADEFNDFFGNGNIEFISLLGTLWDYTGTYTNRIKNGKSVAICNPTISILGGNTPTGFALAFPPEILGQGFFSRILLIYGEPNGKRIPFPRPPDPRAAAELCGYLQAMRVQSCGPAKLTTPAEGLLGKIYTSYAGVDDVRFESYSNRRFSHLLKLTLVAAANRLSSTITESDVIHANSILTFTEQLMPKALGEFGKSKHSDVSHKILTLINSSHGIVSFREIWSHVHTDLEKMQDLATLLTNLKAADKIQQAPGGLGFLPKRKLMIEQDDSMVDFSLLTEEERRMTI